ncbi:hopanoid-associated sugar epimerase [Bradyrhizobium sp. ORS 375]|uniref:hopanoid-associated sugar epimerase n=1 Tax=Bradyrhizobium sp. (strain ORS 375) TaxID=566679 RepID=UPI0002D258C2|nr:hopanoid-associated sugar epimerase [Bradyrhizobium sp. ORS 375]
MSLSKADVLLTGASGFIGSAVLREAVRQGFRVRALVRRGSHYADLSSESVHFAYGDLLDSASLRQACEGCRFLFHVAADYRLSLHHGARVLACNVMGTDHLMSAALRAGIERIVYTSSVATLRYQVGDASAEEPESLPLEMAVGPYKRSKILAERLVLQKIAEDNLAAVVVNPSAPIGPRDWRPTPTGRILVAAARGRMPAFVDTGLNLVHVDDVAKGHLAALHRGRIGQRYVLGGQNVSLSDLLAEVASQLGRRFRAVRLPWYAAVPAALAGEASAFLTGREPLATWTGVQLARHRMYFNTAKAARELGYHARSYRLAVHDALSWFEANGYGVRRSAACGGLPTGL